MWDYFLSQLGPLVSGLGVFLAYLSLYFATQIYPFMEIVVTLSGYTVVSIIFAVIVAKYFPVTRGKSSGEIYEYLENM